MKISTKNHQPETAFVEVVNLIHLARERAFQAVNTSLIDLYWQVGNFISVSRSRVLNWVEL